jgi:hypothetical protein
VDIADISGRTCGCKENAEDGMESRKVLFAED